MQKICYEFDNYTCQIAYESFLGTREEQQDSYYINANTSSILAVVCDGMGGLNNGKIASNIATYRIGELFKQKNENDDFPKFFEDASDLLDEAVSNYSKNNCGNARSGTTIVAAGIEYRKLYWMSCGDSRMYIVREKELVQITHDHNYKLELDSLYSDSKISKDQYNKGLCHGEALISYIGMGGIELIDINQRPVTLCNDDIILLASDGMYKCLSEAEISEIIHDNMSDVGVLTEKLLANAIKNAAGGSQDNTTIIAVKYSDK